VNRQEYLRSVKNDFPKCATCGLPLDSGNCPPSAIARGRGCCHTCNNKRAIESRKRNPKSFILYRLRGNAKVRGRACTLELKDIPDIPKYCPVFSWIKLEYRAGSGRQDNSPSVDRIDNTKGYERGNIRIISYLANKLKSDATDEQLAALGNDARKRIKRKELQFRRNESNAMKVDRL
jgi:hypothetical protein